MASKTTKPTRDGNTTDKEYTSGVPGVPLEVFLEHLRMKVASRSQAGTLTSIPSSPPLDEVDTVYSCAVSIPSQTDERRLISLRSWY